MNSERDEGRFTKAFKNLALKAEKSATERGDGWKRAVLLLVSDLFWTGALATSIVGGVLGWAREDWSKNE